MPRYGDTCCVLCDLPLLPDANENEDITPAPWCDSGDQRAAPALQWLQANMALFPDGRSVAVRSLSGLMHRFVPEDVFLAWKREQQTAIAACTDSRVALALKYQDPPFTHEQTIFFYNTDERPALPLHKYCLQRLVERLSDATQVYEALVPHFKNHKFSDPALLTWFADHEADLQRFVGSAKAFQDQFFHLDEALEQHPWLFVPPTENETNAQRFAFLLEAIEKTHLSLRSAKVSVDGQPSAEATPM